MTDLTELLAYLEDAYRWNQSRNWFQYQFQNQNHQFQSIPELILESRYFEPVWLQKLIDILQLNFWKFHKKTVQYFVQDDHLFHWQDCNVLLHWIVNQSEKWNQIIQALHDEFDHKDKNVMFIKISQYY